MPPEECPWRRRGWSIRARGRCSIDEVCERVTTRGPDSRTAFRKPGLKNGARRRDFYEDQNARISILDARRSPRPDTLKQTDQPPVPTNPLQTGRAIRFLNVTPILRKRAHQRGVGFDPSLGRQAIAESLKRDVRFLGLRGLPPPAGRLDQNQPDSGIPLRFSPSAGRSSYDYSRCGGEKEPLGKGGGSIRGGEKVGIPSSYFGFPSPRAWISFLLIWKTFFRGLAGLELLPLRSRTDHAPTRRDWVRRCWPVNAMSASFTSASARPCRSSDRRSC